MKILNIVIGLLLLAGFCFAGANISQTFPVARAASLSSFIPHPTDYLWQLNIRRAPLSKGRLFYYADYYRNLLEVYPSLREIYGLLGACYYDLGDEAKALACLKKAVALDPLNSWNFYNLAVLYLHESRFTEARAALQEFLRADPQKSLRRLFSSQDVYLPLLSAGGSNMLVTEAEHLKFSYETGYYLYACLGQVEDAGKIKEAIGRMDLKLYAF